MSDAPLIEPYAAAIRKLLKGVVYHDDAVWSQLRDYELPIREYLGKIGLSVHLDEIGNFAYLKDASHDDDQRSTLPALTSRQRLSFFDTVLLVLLRERLDEHEGRNFDGGSLLLSQEELIDMLRVFVGEHPDARKLEQNTGTSVNRLKRYGFLTERQDGRLEVRPLIRAKVSADEMDDLKARLLHYVQPDNEGDNHDDPE